MLGIPKHHALCLSLLLALCVTVLTVVPGAMDAYAGKFWDAAVWVAGCFS
ncbi:hypothetical protein [Kiloniella sp. b19]